MDRKEIINYLKKLENFQHQRGALKKSDFNRYHDLSIKCTAMEDELRRRLPHTKKVIDPSLTAEEVEIILKNKSAYTQDVKTVSVPIQMDQIDELEAFFDKTKTNLQAIKRSSAKKGDLSRTRQISSFGSSLDMTSIGKLNGTMMHNSTRITTIATKEPVLPKFNSEVFRELTTEVENLEASLESKTITQDLAMDSILRTLERNEVKLLTLFHGKHNELNKSIENAVKIEFPEDAADVIKNMGDLISKISANKEYSNAYAVQKGSDKIPLAGIVTDLAAHARF